MGSVLNRVAVFSTRTRFLCGRLVEIAGVLLIFAGLWLSDEDVRGIWQYASQGRCDRE